MWRNTVEIQWCFSYFSPKIQKGSESIMAKFNQSTKGKNCTVNKQGYAAHKIEDYTKLVTQVLTTFFGEPKFYGKNDHEIVALAKEMAERDPEFVAKLAVFARKEFNMRSITHVLTAILANSVNGKAEVRKLIPAVVSRADDMTEILSAYIAMYGKPIPNSLKKGLADTFVRFDEYALAKYKGANKELNMRDVLRICHPSPKNEAQSALWKRCIDDTLAIPVTWETELSAKGNTREVWESLIDQGAVKYMAMLRNLRNIIKAGVSSEHLMKVCATIADPEQVRKSKQFPFSFLSAYKELEMVDNASSRVFDALEDAVEASIANMPRLPGRTAIAVDVSGSMKMSTISKKSKMTPAEIACLLGVMAAKICDDSIFMTFDTKLYKNPVSSRGGILQQARSIRVTGGGTDLFLPVDYLVKNKEKVDRIIMLSDNEINGGWNRPGWNNRNTVQSAMDQYRNEVNANAFVHMVDLQGYGTVQFFGGKTNLTAGWSEKLIEFFNLAEAGIDTLVNRVKNYTF
jgi:hypothetical protein